MASFASLFADMGVEDLIRGFSLNVANYQPIGIQNDADVVITPAPNGSLVRALHFAHSSWADAGAHTHTCTLTHASITRTTGLHRRSWRFRHVV